MKLGATIIKNSQPENLTQVSGKVIPIKKNEAFFFESQKPSANHFGAGLNNLTSYLDE